MDKNTRDSNTFTEKTAKKIVEALENGSAPWVKPWKGEDLSATMPINPISGKPYKGINFINLSIEQTALGSNDPRWLTYKQAASIGAQVRQGEKGTTIQYWEFSEEIEKTDEDGKTIYNNDGQPEKITIQLENPKAFYSTVFNATQIDGMPELKRDPSTEKSFKAINAAEKIIANSGAVIKYIDGSSAYYLPKEDEIVLPTKSQFKTEMGFYSTALHELGHWTGHSSRLDRDLNHSFGTSGYAREELRAEIASFMLCSELSVDFDPTNHYAYIDSWVSALRDKPSEIFKAAADAGKITHFLQGFNMEIEKEQSQEETKGSSISRSQKASLEDENAIVADELELKTPPKTFNEKTYLVVPYKEKEIAKANGAKWDNEEKLWYAPAGEYREKLEQFIPENAEAKTLSKKMEPIDIKTAMAEFKQAMESKGLIIDGDPILNSNKVIRVPVEGDKGGQRSGAYIFFTDGRPAGMIQNFKTGTKENWTSQGLWENVSPEEEAEQRAKIAQNKADRKKEQLEKHNEISQKVEAEFGDAKAATDEHPYLVQKGIKNHGLKLDARGNLLMPLSDVEGKIWTAQHIGINGYKGFEPGGKKEGNFYIIGAGSTEELKTALICEGYATGASIFEATNHPVIVAVDAYNLANVATAIHEKFPDKHIVIAADNDIQKELDGKDNVGKLKAEAAAEAVKGIFIAPRFTPLEIIKGATDFNDLAASRGLEEVKKQLNIALKQSHSKGEDEKKEWKQEEAKKTQRERNRQLTQSQNIRR